MPPSSLVGPPPGGTPAHSRGSYARGMTRPGSPSPGWYPDPDGAPGMVRWWNGAGWSDVATPAGPGVAVQRSPVLAPPTPGPGAGLGTPSSPPFEQLPPALPRATGRRGWLWALVVVVL